MFKRYAIFYTPSGPLADFGAAWLGWDSASGTVVPHPDVPGIDVDGLTRTPRKYGFHATLKAPFRLAEGATETALRHAAEAFADAHGPAPIGRLEVRSDHGFLALRPVTQTDALRDLAAATVRDFDSLRAPLSDAEIARRRQSPLSTRLDQQMLAWGYPYVFDDFHFHMTLTGKLPRDRPTDLTTALAPLLDPFAGGSHHARRGHVDGRGHRRDVSPTPPLSSRRVIARPALTGTVCEGEESGERT